MPPLPLPLPLPAPPLTPSSRATGLPWSAGRSTSCGPRSTSVSSPDCARRRSRASSTRMSPRPRRSSSSRATSPRNRSVVSKPKITTWSGPCVASVVMPRQYAIPGSRHQLEALAQVLVLPDEVEVSGAAGLGGVDVEVGPVGGEERAVGQPESLQRVHLAEQVDDLLLHRLHLGLVVPARVGDPE